MPTLQQTRERVISMLTDGLELNVSLGKNGSIMVRFEDMSTAAFLDVAELSAEDSTYVTVSAPILSAVPATAELFKWVAIHGTGYRFGGVEAFEEEGGTIFLRYKYAILGDFLDEGELKLALYAVVTTADDLDDELLGQFGGKRWVD